MDEVRKNPYVVPGLTENLLPDWSREIANVILNEVASHYETSIKALSGNRRPAALVYCRQLFCYWVKRHYPQVGLKELGSFLGGRDHTTVIHSIHTFDNLIHTNSRVPTELSTMFSATQEDYQQTSKLLYDACRHFGPSRVR